jgi:hypothetical protein
MRELVPGVHSLGGTKGGRVRAFLVESAGELTLVDTLFPVTAAKCWRRSARSGRARTT